MKLILIIVVVLILAQILYSSYFSLIGHNLSKKVYVGKFEFGSKSKKELKVLVDGDSVAAGVGATSMKNSVAGRIGTYLGESYSVELTNQAISGSKMKDVATRVLPIEKQDLIVLIVSSNDLFRFTNLSDFESETGITLDRYSKKAKKLILVGPGRVFDTDAVPFFMRILYLKLAPKYAEILKSASSKYSNVTYINPTDIKVNAKKYGPTAAVDHFHPNDEGHHFWFDMIKPTLTNL